MEGGFLLGVVVEPHQGAGLALTGVKDGDRDTGDRHVGRGFGRFLVGGAGGQTAESEQDSSGCGDHRVSEGTAAGGS